MTNFSSRRTLVLLLASGLMTCQATFAESPSESSKTMPAPADNTVVAPAAAPSLLTTDKATSTTTSSRLNRLSLNHDRLYLPTRLLLGEENKFVVKAKPGSEVMLYVSPKGEGYKLPNGLPLKVGENFESIGGKVPENGVLSLKVPVPSEDSWEGHYLFIDAVSWTQSDYSDVQQVQLLDATGRRTSENSLVMLKPGSAAGGAPLVMPSMPGIPAGALQQLTQTSQIMGSNDERRKELLDTGARNTNSILDRNTFITRPGFQTSPLQQR